MIVAMAAVNTASNRTATPGIRLRLPKRRSTSRMSLFQANPASTDTTDARRVMTGTPHMTLATRATSTQPTAKAATPYSKPTLTPVTARTAGPGVDAGVVAVVVARGSARRVAIALNIRQRAAAASPPKPRTGACTRSHAPARTSPSHSAALSLPLGSRKIRSHPPFTATS